VVCAAHAPNAVDIVLSVIRLSHLQRARKGKGTRTQQRGWTAQAQAHGTEAPRCSTATHVHDVWQLLDVNAAGCNVGADQEP